MPRKPQLTPFAPRPLCHPSCPSPCPFSITRTHPWGFYPEESPLLGLACLPTTRICWVSTFLESRHWDPQKVHPADSGCFSASSDPRIFKSILTQTFPWGLGSDSTSSPAPRQWGRACWSHRVLTPTAPTCGAPV